MKDGKLFRNVDIHVYVKPDQFSGSKLNNYVIISANVRVTKGKANAAVKNTTGLCQSHLLRRKVVCEFIVQSIWVTSVRNLLVLSHLLL